MDEERIVFHEAVTAISGFAADNLRNYLGHWVEY